MVLYSCFRFCIFDIPILKEDVFQIDGASFVLVIFMCSTK